MSATDLISIPSRLAEHCNIHQSQRQFTTIFPFRSLNWKYSISIGVARALKDLPKISDAFRAGRLSYSKVRAMTRVGTPDNEDYLLMIAKHGTAAHVDRLVALYRQVKRNEAPTVTVTWCTCIPILSAGCWNNPSFG